jgi:FKBP-type peptidyl-prolyl cis-trans isomerase FkpA
MRGHNEYKIHATRRIAVRRRIMVTRAVFSVFVLATLALGCRSATTEDGQSRTNRTTLETIDVRAGTGTEVRKGSTVAVHYTGWLYHPTKEGNKGRQFDSSRTRNVPFEFQVGKGEVIQGLDEGMPGMKAGGLRRIVIPSGMAYGPAGAGDQIPPDATLVFDIELLAVK